MPQSVLWTGHELSKLLVADVYRSVVDVVCTSVVLAPALGKVPYMHSLSGVIYCFRVNGCTDSTLQLKDFHLYSPTHTADISEICLDFSKDSIIYTNYESCKCLIASWVSGKWGVVKTKSFIWTSCNTNIIVTEINAYQFWECPSITCLLKLSQYACFPPYSLC